MTIPIILSTGSLFTYDIDTIMALAADVGFDGLELMVDWRRETYQPEHLRKLMARHGLPILAVHSPFAKMVIDNWPSNPVDSIKHSVRLAERLDARTVVAHPPARWLRLQGVMLTPYQSRKISIPLPIVGQGRLGQWLKYELPAFQATTHIKIAVENMPCRRLGPLRLNPHYYPSPLELSQFQYLTLDTTHVGARDMDLLSFYEQIAPQVAHIHLSNFNGKEHQLPHHGHLPLSELLARLAQKQFDGLISLELGPQSLQAGDETQVKQNLRDSLAYCRQAIPAGACAR
jgi:sugar phosphate isomerase/epimerase